MSRYAEVQWGSLGRLISWPEHIIVAQQGRLQIRSLSLELTSHSHRINRQTPCSSQPVHRNQSTMPARIGISINSCLTRREVLANGIGHGLPVRLAVQISGEPPFRIASNCCAARHSTGMGVMSDRQSAPTWLRAYFEATAIRQRFLLDWPKFLEQAPQRDARTAIPMHSSSQGKYAAQCIVLAEDPSNHEQEARHAP